jgi:pseudouridine synthase
MNSTQAKSVMIYYLFHRNDEKTGLIVKERVQKLMSQAGIASRRASEEMIRQGRVRVNGKVITVGDKADPEKDVVDVDGQRLKLRDVETVYYVFYKPPNVLSANTGNPDDDRSTVRELLPVEGHLFTVGRLDAESEGLMILTNDGELVNRLAHPRYEHTKTYKVTVYGTPTQETLEQWQNGVWLEEGKSAPCYVKVLSSEKDTTTLRVVMIEGKKRQIRRIAAQLGHPVRKLMRTHIGQLGIGTLRRGEWYRLDEEEIAAMQIPAWELEMIRKRRRILRQQRGTKPQIQRGSRRKKST